MIQENHSLRGKSVVMKSILDQVGGKGTRKAASSRILLTRDISSTNDG